MNRYLMEALLALSVMTSTAEARIIFGATITENRKAFVFHLQNIYDYDVQCSFFLIEAEYVDSADSSTSFGVRDVFVQDVLIPEGETVTFLEAGIEIIRKFEEQNRNAVIHRVIDGTRDYSCKRATWNPIVWQNTPTAFEGLSIGQEINPIVFDATVEGADDLEIEYTVIDNSCSWLTPSDTQLAGVVTEDAEPSCQVTMEAIAPSVSEIQAVRQTFQFAVNTLQFEDGEQILPINHDFRTSAMTVTNNGSAVVAGTEGDTPIVVLSSPDGAVQWKRVFNFKGSVKTVQMHPSHSDMVLVAGSRGQNAMVYALDIRNGSTLWSFFKNKESGERKLEGTGLIPLANGNTVVSIVSNKNIELVKLDSFGNQLSLRTLTGQDRASLSSDEQGTIYLATQNSQEQPLVYAFGVNLSQKWSQKIAGTSGYTKDIAYVPGLNSVAVLMRTDSVKSIIYLIGSQGSTARTHFRSDYFNLESITASKTDDSEIYGVGEKRSLFNLEGVLVNINRNGHDDLIGTQGQGNDTSLVDVCATGLGAIAAGYTFETFGTRYQSLILRNSF